MSDYTDRSDESYIVSSSVPFVLVGARRKGSGHRRDRVLVRAAGSPMELLGYVHEQEVDFKDYDQQSASSSFWGKVGFRMVRSKVLPPSESITDQRPSTYVLAWSGSAPVTPEIEKRFDASLPDALIAMDSGSQEEVEWAIADVIFAIQRQERRNRRRQKLILTIGAVNGAIAIGIALWLLLR